MSSTRSHVISCDLLNGECAFDTNGAVLWDVGVQDITIRNPLPHEVTVKIAACGICHTDEHLDTGDCPSLTGPLAGTRPRVTSSAKGSAVEGFAVCGGRRTDPLDLRRPVQRFVEGLG